MIQRYLGAIAFAGVVTFGLFFLMQYLIAHGEDPLKKITSIGNIDFIRLKKEPEQLEVKKRLPKKPPVDKPPPPPDLAKTRSLRPDASNLNVGAFDVDVNIDTGSVDLSGAASDGDILPLVRVPAQYPRRAEAAGIEGWVIVEFTITRTGTVIDPFVVESHPSAIFNRAALRSVERWKYKPRIEDGEPVERGGVRVQITFELADE